MISVYTPIEVDQRSGRFRTEADRSAYIRQLMIQVLMTAPGERINRPQFGCGLRSMVFSPNNPATGALTEVLIYQALTTWVGELIVVERIEVHPTESTLAVTITYRDRESGRSNQLNQEMGV